MKRERKNGTNRFHLPEPKVDETIVEAIKDFPDYNKENGAETYVGSKQYWESVFKDETNRDPELHKKFGKLHNDIIEMIVKFCEENNIEDVDEVHIQADGLKDSYGSHTWTPGTDSSMYMRKLKKGEDGLWEREMDDFLFEF